MKPALHYLYYSKYLGLLLVIAGIVIIVLEKANHSEIPLLVGLFTILISTEKIHDERSQMIKTTSLYIAFVLSYGFKLLTSNFFDHGLITFQLVEINHFIILVLGIANVIFYSRMFLVKG